jgi:hypothetical protein
MKKETLQIKELNFELTYPEDEEALPAFEIENNTSAILVRVEIDKAIELRNLLTRFIEVSHD